MKLDNILDIVKKASLAEYKASKSNKVKSQEKIANSVLIHPGVSKISVQKGCIKTIPPKTWAETAELLIQKGKKLMLAGGPDDSECIEIIRNYLSQKGLSFEDYYGKTRNLKDLAELIAKAEQFICSDSAPLHIAVALKTKTYVIFGPTDDKKLIPQSELVVPVKADDKCPLKPCLWERRLTTCDKLDCLKITAQDVVSKMSL